MPSRENILRVLPRLDETNVWEAREKFTRFRFRKNDESLRLTVVGLDVAHRTKIRDQFAGALAEEYVRDRNPIVQQTVPPEITYVFRPIRIQG